MLVFRFGTTKFKLDFSFAAIVAIYTYLDRQGIGIVVLSALLCHELGHLIAMLLFDLSINEIVLYGAGVRMSSNHNKLAASKKFIVCSAGCMMNLLLAAVSYIFGAYKFAVINLVMCCFNLLPIGELDGAEIAELLLQRCFSYNKVHSIQTIMQYATCLLIITLSVVFLGKLSITLITTTLYIILVAFSKYKK